MTDKEIEEVREKATKSSRFDQLIKETAVDDKEKLRWAVYSDNMSKV